MPCEPRSAEIVVDALPGGVIASCHFASLLAEKGDGFMKSIGLPHAIGCVIWLGLAAAAQAQLQVVSTSPALNAVAPASTAIEIDFDRAVDTATITDESFRAFGRWSGPVSGTFSFSNGNQTVRLTPDDPFTAGELVYVNLSHDVVAADLSALRDEGFAFQFVTATVASPATFAEVDTFTNMDTPSGPQTRIYGAAATDLDNDGYLDLATVNEVSADVRVFLSQADGSATFGTMLAPQDIGVEASPNETADFDNDGNVDMVIGAASSDDVWILLGAGDGTFSSAQNIVTGGEPHGVAPLDVDGDGDLDVVNANVGANDLSLLVNDGNGVFGAPTFFSGGVDGEYGLAAADMDGDGITDLVVAGRNGSEIVTMLGNGDGTFTAAGAAQSTGGSTWVVVLGDMDGDGIMDAATANDGDGNVGVLLGVGDGTFAPVDVIPIGSHVPSVDLGDLDGDGDLDMVVSSFGGGFWRWFRNDGTASFTAVEDFVAPDNPSCSVLFDADNDGDLDMALTDEIADVVTIMRNGDAPVGFSCSPAPSACRAATVAGKSRLLLKDGPADADKLVWVWKTGESTTKAELGDPPAGDDFALCLYHEGELVRGFAVPGAGNCAGKPCWKEVGKGFVYKDKGLTPDGILVAKLLEGSSDDAKMIVKGKGAALALPSLVGLDDVIDVQLQKDGGPCWGARYSPPFKKSDAAALKAVSDDAAGVLAPLWSEIQAQVLGPQCAGCHGGSAGLAGLGGCNSGYASLVDVASSEHTTMDRVEPGDPDASWLMHKLDGTQGIFTAQCFGNFCGNRMPLGGPFLSQADLDAVRAWIANGAANDCP